MSAFDVAIAALFTDPNLTVEATYLPQGGGNVPVRVVMRAPDMYQRVGATLVETPTQTLEVPVASCPLLAQGEQFIVNGTTYTVQGEPQRDELQLTWMVDLYAN